MSLTTQEFSVLLREAIDAKKRERGGKYTLRQLAEASDVDHTYISKVLHGKRQPTRNVIKAWAKALDPYFPVDRALVAAGLMPERPVLVKLIDRALDMRDEAVGNVLGLHDALSSHDDELLDDILSPDAKYGRRFRDDEDDEDGG